MRAHPTTAYVTASPETWGLIRGSYLSGLSAPTAAARFGVSVHAIRKRARREGWTKAKAAALGSPWASPLHPPAPLASSGADPAAAPPPGSSLPPGSPAEVALIEGWRAPLHIRPNDLARKALANAAHAVRAGSGLNALRLARAASEIARLDGQFEWAVEDVARTEEQQEAQLDMMRSFVRTQALELARDLAAGRPLPEPYADLATDFACRTAEDAPSQFAGLPK